MADDAGKILKFPGMSQREARMDTTALLIAKLVELSTGERDLIENSMRSLIEGGPEKMGGVVLTLLNLCAQYATQSGTNIKGMKDLCDFLTGQIARER